MTITLDGTNGVTTPDVEVSSGGSASVPAITVTGDTNTGIFFPAADTIAFAEGGAEAMRIDSSGNVGIGTTTPSSFYSLADNLVIGTGSGGHGLTIYSGTGDSGFIGFNDTATNSMQGFIQYNHSGDYMAFAPNGAERARINSAGAFLVGVTGLSANGYKLEVGGSNGGIWANATGIGDSCFVSKSTNNTVTYQYVGLNNAGTIVFAVAQNGNVTNTNNSYGAISDVKLKQDIVDAGSQWNDIKSLRVRKFRYKSEPDGFLQMGVVAQELESVSPGLIEETPDYEEVEVTDEEGNVTTERQATGTVTKSVKYSVLYMKAVKALQEAMERIETLEAKVAALEANNV